MTLLLRAWAILVVTTKRLLSHRWLALATGLGLVVSIALTVSIPMYADAVYHRILHKELAGDLSSTRPPFKFLFRYVGGWNTPVEFEALQPVDQYLSTTVGRTLGPPCDYVVRYFKTSSFRLFAPQNAAYAESTEALTRADIAFMSGLEDHITLLEGRFPAPAPPAQDSVIEVLISESRAFELGLQVSETYIAYTRHETEEGEQTLQLPVRIAGVWRPTDSRSEFWFSNPEGLFDKLFVPEDTFRDRISPYMHEEVHQAIWYLIVDGSDVRTGDVAPLLVRINTMRQQAASLLPGTRLDDSPERSLQWYRASAAQLTFMLYAFSVPIISLILAFVSLVMGLAVERQRNEIAVLRSRGATAVQVIGIAALEGVFIGAVALAVGLPTGEAITQIVGKARTFLDFTLQSHLRVSITLPIARTGLIALGLALVTQVMPTVSAARYTIVTYKQERARTLRPPWWQRAGLDILLLIPVAYGTYLLRNQGTIGLPVAEGTLVSDPFQNPLLLLVPALSIFACTLLILRVLPAGLGAIAWIATRTRSVGALLAARHLSRSPGFYAAPLVLLILTLSLSTFTASLAVTLDHHLYDQVYYQTGGDMYLVETGADPIEGGMPGSSSPEADAADLVGGPEWLLLPVSEHLEVDGVQAAARLGRYIAVSRLSGGIQKGTFIGVDRTDFPQVASWRNDYAPTSLGNLMNQLAITSNGVLVSRAYLQRHALNVGDIFRLRVASHGYRIDTGQRVELDLKIVGTFDLFPTWYPDEADAGPLWVGNLDYLFERAGGLFPYDVLLKTDASADYRSVLDGVREMDFRVWDWDSAPHDISTIQELPERQGLFGVLSVGFVAAALLTVLGFLLYAIFSFRRRTIDLGILRAVGLSSGQMTLFLAWELAFLILTGLIAGTGLGVWVSDLFIPYLQVGSQTPPFVVEIAWSAILQIYALFGLLFVVSLAGLALLLMRMRIFQAIKLGETQ